MSSLNSKKKYLCKEYPKVKCCQKKYNCFSLVTRNFLVLFNVIIGYQVADLFHIVPTRFSHLSHTIKLNEFAILSATISLVLNIFFLFIFLIKIETLQYRLPDKVIKWSLKVMIVVFGLTSFSHLFSVYFIDKYIFAPITFFLAYLTYIVMIEEHNSVST
jgi:hypothetical protein